MRILDAMYRGAAAMAEAGVHVVLEDVIWEPQVCDLALRALGDASRLSGRAVVRSRSQAASAAGPRRPVRRGGGGVRARVRPCRSRPISGSTRPIGAWATRADEIVALVRSWAALTSADLDSRSWPAEPRTSIRSAGHEWSTSRPKDPTHRRADRPLQGVHAARDDGALVANREVTKGDVLAVARVAGIQAAKRTSDVIPLCHPAARRVGAR